MRRSWVERLGDWLPAEARRDLFLPSLADLAHERLRRERAARSAASHARLRRIWFGAAALGLFFGCLRLYAVERVQALARRPLQAGSRRQPGRLVGHILT